MLLRSQTGHICLKIGLGLRYLRFIRRITFSHKPFAKDTYLPSAKADRGTRTPDILITNQSHYQLCYIGIINRAKHDTL